MSAPCLPFASHSSKKRRRNADSELVVLEKETVDADEGNNDENDDDGFEDIETMDATEYLSRVVHQAKKLPEFFVARETTTSPTAAAGIIPDKYRQFVPIDGSAASLSYLFSTRASLTRPPSKEHVPHHTNEWTETSLANFERLRLYLERCREQGVGGKLTDRVAFPPMKDRAGWHIFCVGSEEAAGNMNSYFGDDYSRVKTTGNDAEEEEKSLPEWRQNIPLEGHSATVKVVSQMDQVLVRQVLSHLCHYVVQGWKLTAQRTLWIYALLARLEKPVHRDDASTLFGLLKVLTRTRSTLNLSIKGRTELSRLNLLIVILGVYFEQGASIVMSVLDQE
jgi:gem associated protein 2